MCKNTFFAEHDQATNSNYSSVASIVVKGELANANRTYDTKTQAYVPLLVRNVSYQKKAVLVKYKQVSEAVVRRCSSKWCS